MGIFNFIKAPKMAQPSFYRDPFLPSAGTAECEYEYARLQKHLSQSSRLYVCCCGHDNALSLRAGKSSFLEPTCGKCGHILCSECLASDIIASFDADKWFFWHDLYDLSKHELFQVCSGCGSSARAESRGAHPHWPGKCNGCREKATVIWRKYVVNPRPSRPDAKMLDDFKMARIV